MSKKIIALVLCLACAFPLFSACKHEEGYVGPIINMYLSEMVYDFDPLYAFNNESAQKLVSLLFEPLFRIKENGKLEKALVKSYKYTTNELNEEYILNLKFNETYWSDGTYVSANDLVYAWKRIMDPENSNEAASLLFDIKLVFKTVLVVLKREGNDAEKVVLEIEIKTENKEIEKETVGAGK